MTQTHYRTVAVDGLDIFYREAGPSDAPTLLLLHGFPSSSHMYRDLIPALADRFHLVAPDYPGFGYSAAPPADAFAYTFDHLADVMEGFVRALGLARFGLYIQDYGAPVGLRLATRHPDWIEALVVQNAVAHEEGLGAAFDVVKAIWADRTPRTEQGIRDLLTPAFTKLQYVSGARDPGRVSPDAWTLDQTFLDRPGNDAIQIDLQDDYRTNPPLYPAWQAYFRAHQPPTLVAWGKNDLLFTVAGALAYQRDLTDIEVHLLDAGHFALEEESAAIAALIARFYEARPLAAPHRPRATGEGAI